MTVSELPAVRGDRALLVSAFRNLIGDALKFHSSDAPVIRIEAHRHDGEWEFSCADNGIGVEPEFAERIFVIFQRLHSRDSYPGTGIGLAMGRPQDHRVSRRTCLARHELRRRRVRALHRAGR